jgi:hypothetical protein
MARLGSCIAKGHIIYKATKFAIEHCTSSDLKWAFVWVDERSSNGHIAKVMSDMVYEQAYKFVLLNHPTMKNWMEL